MKVTALLAVAGLALATQGPAQAETVHLNVTGPGISAALALTYGTGTDATYSNAFVVTGISGTFSDSNNGLNIVDASVGPLVALNRSAGDPTNLLAPNDRSHFAVTVGPIGPGGQPSDHVSYDNLYWPAGSPQTASDYTPHGGVLDIYGLLFSIGNGMNVNLWSNGVFGNAPADYGLSIVTSAAVLDHAQGGVSVSAVPLPASFGFLGAGLIGLLMMSRRRRTVSA